MCLWKASTQEANQSDERSQILGNKIGKEESGSRALTEWGRYPRPLGWISVTHFTAIHLVQSCFILLGECSVWKLSQMTRDLGGLVFGSSYGICVSGDVQKRLWVMGREWTWKIEGTTTRKLQIQQRKKKNGSARRRIHSTEIIKDLTQQMIHEPTVVTHIGTLHQRATVQRWFQPKRQISYGESKDEEEEKKNGEEEE